MIAENEDVNDLRRYEQPATISSNLEAGRSCALRVVYYSGTVQNFSIRIRRPN